MSPGARNCPFFTLIGFPVAAAAARMSVWRQRNAGTCSTSTDLAPPARASSAEWKSVSTGTPTFASTSARIASPSSIPGPRNDVAARAVGLVVGRLVDERDADARRDVAQPLRVAQRVVAALDDAGPRDPAAGAGPRPRRASRRGTARRRAGVAHDALRARAFAVADGLRPGRRGPTRDRRLRRGLRPSSAPAAASGRPRGRRRARPSRPAPDPRTSRGGARSRSARRRPAPRAAAAARCTGSPSRSRRRRRSSPRAGRRPSCRGGNGRSLARKSPDSQTGPTMSWSGSVGLGAERRAARSPTTGQMRW